MNADKNSPLIPLLKLRLLVGFLGERAQFGWWPTAFFEASGHLFLEPIFAKTRPVAQYHGVTEAGRRHHDEHLNVGSYHLFRLPEELEQDLHALAQGGVGEAFLAASCHDRQAAFDALTETASAGRKEGSGPVAVGSVSDVTKHLSDLAAVYSFAFASDAQSIPYLVR